MLNKEEILKSFKEIHGNRYDYSLVEYKNTRTKVKIICLEHGIFEQCPSNHIYSKQGCPKCANRHKPSLEEFIFQSNKIHNNKYDYSLVDYKNNSTKVKIICPEHGIFEQKPNGHIIQKSGCLKCSGKYKKSKEEFISQSKEIHGEIYDYSLVDYKNNKKNVKIICPKHGIFEQRPDSHLNREQGCPLCNNSKGELKINKILKDNNFSFVAEKDFENCIDNKKLRFDFYLPEHNLCIEYDGLQHYESVEYWGGIDYLKYVQKHDEIKNDYCKENNINLIRIKYDRKLNSNDVLKKIYSVI